jgi:3-methyladenine DNA glycosylase AlkD
VYEWFETEASAAPFEPSVQKFIAWQLREMYKQALATAAAATATSTATATGVSTAA